MPSRQGRQLGGFWVGISTDGTTGARPAPALGADTAAVLTGLLGRSAAGIQMLTERGIIGGPRQDAAAS